jgi:Ca2+-binding RTX toxin-like protein
VRFFRDVANVTMDLDDVERIEFRALGGADNIVVGDMSGTDLANLELDLRGPNGTPDGQGDSVTVNGTQGDDTIGVAGDAGGVSVFGLATKVNIFHQEATLDRLTVNAQGGNDTVDATSLEADGIALTINGGLGADLLRGSEGDDLVNGGDGNDTALLGAGNDTFVWNPGDDNDTIEGQAGQDELLFNGANISEIIDITANGSRLRLTRNIANIVMDTNGLEVVTVNALGGADSISIGDLSGTDASDIRLNLSGSGGTGDAQADTVVVNGTAQDDIIVVTGNASGVSVIGLPAAVHVTGSEVANDRLVINALAGDDVIEASGLAAGAIMLVADGGTGDDVIVGSDGADVLMGGEDDDVLVGGPSVDILDGGFGDNIVIQ